jgi:hypothetical protein
LSQARLSKSLRIIASCVSHERTDRSIDGRAYAKHARKPRPERPRDKRTVRPLDGLGWHS